MRFQKLNNNGEQLPAEATDHAVVLDTITSLMWHHATSPDRLNFKDAESYCKALTTGGFTDWRLPTVEELFLLADRSRFNPTIDTAAFPSCNSSWYWSSSPVASAPADYAWLVHFSGGDAVYTRRVHTAFVRAVRSVAQVTP